MSVNKPLSQAFHYQHELKFLPHSTAIFPPPLSFVWPCFGCKSFLGGWGAFSLSLTPIPSENGKLNAHIYDFFLQFPSEYIWPLIPPNKIPKNNLKTKQLQNKFQFACHSLFCPKCSVLLLCSWNQYWIKITGSTSHLIHILHVFWRHFWTFYSPNCSFLNSSLK